MLWIIVAVVVVLGAGPAWRLSRRTPARGTGRRGHLGKAQGEVGAATYRPHGNGGNLPGTGV